MTAGNFARANHGMYRIVTLFTVEKDQLICLSLWSRDRNDHARSLRTQQLLRNFLAGFAINPRGDLRLRITPNRIQPTHAVSSNRERRLDQNVADAESASVPIPFGTPIDWIHNYHTVTICRASAISSRR
jgi:hypothetical protein